MKLVYAELESPQKEYVDKAIADLREAKRRLPGCAWTRYDYACELIRWMGEPELTEGIDNLYRAVELLETVREDAKEQPYLAKAWNEDSRIQQVLGEYISND